MGGSPPFAENSAKIIDLIWQYFTLGAKINQIEIWNIDSKKYSETVISEYFGILLPNSDRGTNLSHLSDSVYSRAEYHTHLM